MHPSSYNRYRSGEKHRALLGRTSREKVVEDASLVEEYAVSTRCDEVR